MTKITKATFKSFIKRNQGSLFVNVRTAFDGMTDGCEAQKGGFQPAQPTNYLNNTLGIKGVWLVHGSNNYFYHYEDELFIGIHVSNCCGDRIIAIEKQKQAA